VATNSVTGTAAKVIGSIGATPNSATSSRVSGLPQRRLRIVIPTAQRLRPSRTNPKPPLPMEGARAGCDLRQGHEFVGARNERGFKGTLLTTLLVSMRPSESPAASGPTPARNRSASEHATPFPRATPDPCNRAAEGSARIRLRCPHYQLNCPDHFVKRTRLGFQPPLPRGGQPVETSPPVVLRDSPLGLHPSFEQHPIQRGVERAVLDFEIAPGQVVNVPGDAVAMKRTPDGCTDMPNRGLHRGAEERFRRDFTSSANLRCGLYRSGM
jgi:hypothetical protein